MQCCNSCAWGSACTSRRSVCVKGKKEACRGGTLSTSPQNPPLIEESAICLGTTGLRLLGPLSSVPWPAAGALAEQTPALKPHLELGCRNKQHPLSTWTPLFHPRLLLSRVQRSHQGNRTDPTVEPPRLAVGAEATAEGTSRSQEVWKRVGSFQQRHTLVSAVGVAGGGRGCHHLFPRDLQVFLFGAKGLCY